MVTVTVRTMPWSRVLLVVVLANYLAQIVYYLDLYYPRPMAISGTALLGLTLVWFLAGYVGTRRGWWMGHLILLTYLLAMVGFYVANIYGQIVHGYGLLWHFQHHDLPVRMVFAVGYLNMVVGAVAIIALLIHSTPSRRGGSASSQVR
ncbi:MAG TPA: hypothetical protein VGR57_19595 [Ktedonobacterales bacterium]|nr:hypothetical protein [Ktedonobacterales bacterium]